MRRPLCVTEKLGGGERKVQGGNLRATVLRSYFSVLYNFYFRMMTWTAEIQISMKIWSSQWQLKFKQLHINEKKISCNLSNCKLTGKKNLICNCLNCNYHCDVSYLHLNLTPTYWNTQQKPVRRRELSLRHTNLNFNRLLPSLSPSGSHLPSDLARWVGGWNSGKDQRSNCTCHKTSNLSCRRNSSAKLLWRSPRD